jgi:hypothetical protein
MPSFVLREIVDALDHPPWQVAITTLLGEPRKLCTVLYVVIMLTVPVTLTGLLFFQFDTAPVTRLLQAVTTVTVVELQVLTAACVYAEDTNHTLRTIRAHTFLCSTCVVGICCIFGITQWADTTPVHLVWVVPLWFLLWIGIVPLLNSRSATVREHRVLDACSLGDELLTGLFTVIVLTSTIYTIVGAVFIMWYISDPIVEVLIVSFGYPCLKYGLKIGMTRLQTRTGLDKGPGHFPRQIEQRMRLIFTSEILFGMPGQCALVLLPSWEAFFISAVLGSVSQWLSDHAILWKHRHGLSTNNVIQILSMGHVSIDITPPVNTVVELRLLQEAHLEAEDFAEKIIAISAPFIVYGVH